MKAEYYINKLTKIKLDSVFNPYTDVCKLMDRKDAHEIRKNNLLSYLNSMNGKASSIWFGRDLGYRGGRRTGLALTDEFHLHDFKKLYKDISVTKATVGEPMSERTASIIWKMLSQISDPPFLWNIFPFHPHAPDNPMTNRNHTAAERRECLHLTTELIEWLQPDNIIAIGNDSYNALQKMGYDCSYVRHPSYGGQEKFVTGIRELHEMTIL